MTILKRLLPSQDIDALLGDIAEEAPRRSRLWYLSQLFAVLVVGSWRDARRYPGLALRAIGIGVVTLALYYWLVAASVMRVVWVAQNGGFYLGSHWITLPRRSWPEPVIVLTVYALAYVLSGWAIVRLHRAQGVAMLMPFLMLMTTLSLVPLAIVLNDSGSLTRSMPILETTALFGTMFLSIPVGILAGGVLGLAWKCTSAASSRF